MINNTQEEHIALNRLLKLVGASEIFSVLVGRRPNISSGSNLKSVEGLQRFSVQNPQWYAETGSVFVYVSQSDYFLLLDYGAAPSDTVQMLRSFKNEYDATFSERCRRCHRRIWCGRDPVEGQCFCGQKFRIVFDLAVPYHWYAVQYMRCLDCGAQRQPNRPQDGRTHWTYVNSSQMRCDLCEMNRNANPEKTGSAAILT
jgi:hypothetical protein